MAQPADLVPLRWLAVPESIELISRLTAFLHKCEATEILSESVSLEIPVKCKRKPPVSFARCRCSDGKLQTAAYGARDRSAIYTNRVLNSGVCEIM